MDKANWSAGVYEQVDGGWCLVEWSRHGSRERSAARSAVPAAP